jgi:energy-coupling factor transport system ATP-binding protein
VAGLAGVADPRSVKLPAPLAMRRLAELQAAVVPATPEPPVSEGGALIEMRDVEFGYSERPVLRGVNLRIYPGDRIALLGPNGSGKTTLVKHLIGLLRPQRGAVYIDGAPAAKMSVAEIAARVGYVFQSPSHMLFAPTVREELAFGPRNIGQSDAAIAENSRAALAMLDLSGLEERPPLTLSFGQQRRTCIASVLAMRPRVLLMDEPTAGQDYRSYTQFMNGIERLTGLDALTFITHDLDLAIGYANRVILFADGAIMADGAPHEVLVGEELLQRCNLWPTSLLSENVRLLPSTGAFRRLETLASLVAR